jgi:hypothetical protein
METEDFRLTKVPNHLSFVGATKSMGSVKHQLEVVFPSNLG